MWSLSLPFSLPQLPDTVNQELYADSQLQVWAIIGLSELVSASYAEDSYGVVQRVRNTIHMYMPSTYIYFLLNETITTSLVASFVIMVKGHYVCK